jgi:hypothetical protein
VRRRFAGGLGAVVAADTVAADVEVIEVRRQPGDAAVAIIAGVVAGDVRRVLAGGGDAVVAGATSAVWQSAQEPLLFT